ncbi:MAG TPA: hypothetical protein VF161_12660 [Steroidobacteraceae bacterium]
MKYQTYNVMLVGIARWFSVTAVSIEAAIADLKAAYGDEIEVLTWNLG